MTMPPFMTALSEASVLRNEMVNDRPLKRKNHATIPTTTSKRSRPNEKQNMLVDHLKTFVQYQTLQENAVLQLSTKFSPSQDVNSTSKSSLTSRLLAGNQTPRAQSPLSHTYPGAASEPSSPTTQGATKMRKSVSTSNMVVIQGPASATIPTMKNYPKSRFSNINPEHLLKFVLQTQGYSTKPISSLDVKNYFVEMTPQNVAGYDADVIQAVRKQDIGTLRKMLAQGRQLQCCNRFGESILHMACRRGSEEVVRFLLEEAGVSPKLRDDYGRTPLHDACWTRKPELQIVALLLKYSPDLLLVTDKRGHTPLSYARRDHWGAWCKFIKHHRHLLKPKDLLCRS